RHADGVRTPSLPSGDAGKVPLFTLTPVDAAHGSKPHYQQSCANQSRDTEDVERHLCPSSYSTSDGQETYISDRMNGPTPIMILISFDWINPETSNTTITAAMNASRLSITALPTIVGIPLTLQSQG